MFATYTSQEMKGFLMPGSKSSENILSCFCPVAFVILIENLVQTLTTVQKHSVYRQTIPILSLCAVQIIRPNLLLSSHLSCSTLSRKILNLADAPPRRGRRGKGVGK